MRRPPKTRARLLQLLLPLDEDGNFLGASALVLEGCTEVEAVQEVAFREGLALVGDFGLHTFRVASDWANAARSIHGEGFGRYGPIVLEISPGGRASQE